MAGKFWKQIFLGPGYLVAKTVMWRFVWRKICAKSCDIFLWHGITKNVTKICVSTVQRTYFDDLGSIHCVRKTSQKTSQQILTENVIENLTKNVTSQFWKIIPRPLYYLFPHVTLYRNLWSSRLSFNSKHLAATPLTALKISDTKNMNSNGHLGQKTWFFFLS